MRFVREHSAILAIGGIVVFFVVVALLGPPAPPLPEEVVTLSPEEHQRIVCEIASAVRDARKHDGGTQ